MALEWYDSRDGMSDFRRDIIADATMRVCTCRDTHSIEWSKWSEIFVERGEATVLEALKTFRLHKHAVEALDDRDVLEIAKLSEKLQFELETMQWGGAQLGAPQEARALLHSRIRRSGRSLSLPELRDVLTLFTADELAGDPTPTATSALPLPLPLPYPHPSP